MYVFIQLIGFIVFTSSPFVTSESEIGLVLYTDVNSVNTSDSFLKIRDLPIKQYGTV